MPSEFLRCRVVALLLQPQAPWAHEWMTSADERVRRSPPEPTMFYAIVNELAVAAVIGRRLAHAVCGAPTAS